MNIQALMCVALMSSLYHVETLLQVSSKLVIRGLNLVYYSKPSAEVAEVEVT